MAEVRSQQTLPVGQEAPPPSCRRKPLAGYYGFGAAEQEACEHFTPPRWKWRPRVECLTLAELTGRCLVPAGPVRSGWKRSQAWVFMPTFLQGELISAGSHSRVFYYYVQGKHTVSLLQAEMFRTFHSPQRNHFRHHRLSLPVKIEDVTGSEALSGSNTMILCTEDVQFNWSKLVQQKKKDISNSRMIIFMRIKPFHIQIYATTFVQSCFCNLFIL